MSKSLGNVRRARRGHREARRRDPAAVGRRRGLPRGHPHLRRDPEPPRRGVPAHPQHAALPARQPLGLRPGARRACRTRRCTSSTAGRSPARAVSSSGCARAYDDYEFHTVFHALNNFCAVDLSALYLDVLKDRLYTAAARDPRAARGADGVLRDRSTRSSRLHGADPVVHGRGGVGPPAGAPGSESVHLARLPRRPPPTGTTTPSASVG